MKKMNLYLEDSRKNRLIVFFVAVLVLSWLVFGASLADFTTPVFDEIYITLPDSAQLSSSESSIKFYVIDNELSFSISTTPYNFTGSANLFSAMINNGLKDVHYHSTHNVNYISGYYVNGSNIVVTSLAVYNYSHYCYLFFNSPLGDANAQHTIDNIIASLCKHSFAIIEPDQPTCTAVGYEWEKCTICGFKKAIGEIPALGHTPVSVPAQAATCTESGLTAGTKCALCGEFIVKQQVIPPLGHTEVIIPGKAATETETGLTEGKKCSVCGTILVAQEEIPKLIAKNGLWLDDDGVYRLYNNNVIDMETFGIVKFGGGRFFIANALIVKQDGLISDGINWYYVSQGQVADYTGLILYDGEWFYVINGILDPNRAGIVEYDGGRFMIAAGRMLRESNGLIQEPNTGIWYYVAVGKVVDYTGLVQYDGEWFYVKNGILQEGFSGEIEYDGTLFCVLNGQVILPQ